MVIKLFFIALLAFATAQEDQVTTICTYELVNNEYTCRLVNQTISRGEDMENVSGTHLENFGDINVQRLTQENSVVQVFPSKLINRFVNLRSLYMEGVQMRFWKLR